MITLARRILRTLSTRDVREAIAAAQHRAAQLEAELAASRAHAADLASRLELAEAQRDLAEAQRDRIALALVIEQAPSRSSAGLWVPQRRAEA
jgi:chromosome segregation ATPase